MEVVLRMISGNTFKVAARLDDTLAAFHEVVAAELRLLPCELRFCLGGLALDVQDQHKTLRDLDFSGGPAGAPELTVLRIPRLTLEILEGEWVNSRGARIRVKEDVANVSGLVTWPVALDEHCTVVQIGDMRVKSISGVDAVHFQTDTWWRVREQGSCIAVTLRTVGGVSRRVEDMLPHDTLGALRARAAEELSGELTRSSDGIALYFQAQVLHPRDDVRTLAELGIQDGASLLCAR